MSKLIQHTLKAFVKEVDSPSPAPGGGSVAALAATLGVALARMVGHLSIGKKKFKALDPDIQERFTQVFASFTVIEEELLHLIDKDTEAFNLIMAAYQMPKTNDAEVQARNEKIQAGTREAIKVPAMVANLGLAALERLDVILKHGNKQAVSDVGVATLMLSAGIEGAILNVMINLSSLDDPEEIEKHQATAQDLLERTHDMKTDLMKNVHAAIA